MVTRLGMSHRAGNMDFSRVYNQLSSETRNMVEEEVRRTLSESYERARKLLLSRRQELDRLAKALVEFETLNRDEVEKVMRGEALPDRIPVPEDSNLMVSWPGSPPAVGLPGEWPGDNGGSGDGNGLPPPPPGTAPGPDDASGAAKPPPPTTAPPPPPRSAGEV